MEPERYTALVSELEQAAHANPRNFRRSMFAMIALGYGYVVAILFLIVLGVAIRKAIEGGRGPAAASSGAPVRPAFGSLLIQQGESLMYMKEADGSASIPITVDGYGHLFPRGNRRAVDRLVGTAHDAAIRNWN